MTGAAGGARPAAVDPAVRARFPGYRASVVLARGVANGPTDAASEALLRDAERRAPDPGHPHLLAWDDAFAAAGIKAKRHPCSAAALARRARSPEGLPRISRLVDLYNALSVRHALPVGGEDCARLHGANVLRFATGSEPCDVRGASGETEPPAPGEPVWADETGVTCRRWSWRQGERTRLTARTTSALFVLEALEPYATGALEAAAADLGGRLVPRGRGGGVRAVSLTPPRWPRASRAWSASTPPSLRRPSCAAGWRPATSASSRSPSPPPSGGPALDRVHRDAGRRPSVRDRVRRARLGGGRGSARRARAGRVAARGRLGPRPARSLAADRRAATRPPGPRNRRGRPARTGGRGAHAPGRERGGGRRAGAAGRPLLRGGGDLLATGGPGHRAHPGRSRVLDELGIAPEAARRNVVTRGVALDDLISRAFTVGAVACVGRQRCAPCAHLERVSGAGILRALAHRGGLRADVVAGGLIAVGSPVSAGRRDR